MNQVRGARKRTSARFSNTSSIEKHSDISSPDKAIEALRDYSSSDPSDLSFTKGDFFYVADENDTFYFAINPLTGVQGRVKKSHFKTFTRSRPALLPTGSSNNMNDGAISKQSSGSIMNPDEDAEIIDPDEQLTDSRAISGSKYLPVTFFFARTLYDFKATRSDELSVYAGETIYAYAHSNFEWFIARPVGRMGGPGLVPVDFLQPIDVLTGQPKDTSIQDEILSSKLVTVKEWKDSIYHYEREDMILQSKRILLQNHPSLLNANYSIPKNEIITNAEIINYVFENYKFMFIITCQLANGKKRELKRHYNEFYYLQVRLLNGFPAEAGDCKDTVSGISTRRIIPYIPHVSTHVTERKTKKRMRRLNSYVKEVIMLPDYIARSECVKEMFMVKDNGFDKEFDGTNNLEKSDSLYNTTTPKNTGSKDIDQIDYGASVKSSAKSQSSAKKNIFPIHSPNTSNNFKNYTKTLESPSSNNITKQESPVSSTSSRGLKKIKFFYNGDMFALKLDPNCSLQELETKLGERLYLKACTLHVRLDDGDAEEITNDELLRNVIEMKLKISVHQIL